MSSFNIHNENCAIYAHWIIDGRTSYCGEQLDWSGTTIYTPSPFNIGMQLCPECEKALLQVYQATRRLKD